MISVKAHDVCYFVVICLVLWHRITVNKFKVEMVYKDVAVCN